MRHTLEGRRGEGRGGGEGGQRVDHTWEGGRKGGNWLVLIQPHHGVYCLLSLRVGSLEGRGSSPCPRPHGSGAYRRRPCSALHPPP